MRVNISNNVTKQAIKDACTAYKNFFRGLQKFPGFKSKKRSMPKFYQDNVKIRFSNTHGQSDIRNPLSLLAHNQITASQFIRRGLYPF